jgi:hypothetical protein
LLSANKANRRIRGVKENARQQIVLEIEHNAKLDEPSVGIYQDPQTGEVKPISQPTSPMEQFMYMMIRHALVRHYYIQESIVYQPPVIEQAKLGSENHNITIEPSYLDEIPEEFIDNPDQYIFDKCVVLKTSKAEGEYQNELVALMTLKNGQQVIIKKIELKKAKDAKNEYKVLQRAKKAGLPTAEPVGFVEGKSSDDSSYVMMTKLEGTSGRLLERNLRKSGKYTEGQIIKIMQQVSEMNSILADRFRQSLRVDKEWRMKDLIIDFDEESCEVKGGYAIDFERARFFDPVKPKYVEQYTPASNKEQIYA